MQWNEQSGHCALFIQWTLTCQQQVELLGLGSPVLWGLAVSLFPWTAEKVMTKRSFLRATVCLFSHWGPVPVHWPSVLVLILTWEVSSWAGKHGAPIRALTEICSFQHYTSCLRCSLRCSTWAVRLGMSEISGMVMRWCSCWSLRLHSREKANYVQPDPISSHVRNRSRAAFVTIEKASHINHGQCLIPHNVHNSCTFSQSTRHFFLSVLTSRHSARNYTPDEGHKAQRCFKMQKNCRKRPALFITAPPACAAAG